MPYEENMHRGLKLRLGVEDRVQAQPTDLQGHALHQMPIIQRNSAFYGDWIIVASNIEIPMYGKEVTYRTRLI